jgi:hypothetical protein
METIQLGDFLKSGELFSFDSVLLTEGSQYTCVADFVGWKTIELKQPITRTQCDVRRRKIHKHSFFHCHTTSISMYFNNCCSFERRMAEISFFQSSL